MEVKPFSCLYLSGSPTYNGMMKARTLPEMHCETFLLFLSFRLVSWDISVWVSMSRFHEYYWLSLCRCSWLVGDVYVQKIEYCMRKCMVACSYTIPPPSSSQGLHDHPLSSSPRHVHTIVLLLALKYFLFQLGMMIWAVWTWDNLQTQSEGWGREGICPVVSCFFHVFLRVGWLFLFGILLCPLYLIQRRMDAKHK